MPSLEKIGEGAELCSPPQLNGFGPVDIMLPDRLDIGQLHRSCPIGGLLSQIRQSFRPPPGGLHHERHVSRRVGVLHHEVVRHGDTFPFKDLGHRWFDGPGHDLLVGGVHLVNWANDLTSCRGSQSLLNWTDCRDGGLRLPQGVADCKAWLGPYNRRVHKGNSWTWWVARDVVGLPEKSVSIEGRVG